MPKVKTPDSSLVSYIYPYNTYHYNIRTHSIDTITIHHVANGAGFNRGYSPDTLRAIFDSVGKNGSCHYDIDSNGGRGQMLNEKYRCWCSNSRENDHRAICIEVANCAGAPTWAISDKAMKSLIELCADICKRNGKKKMVWISDKARALAYNPKSDELRMTLHKWFAATGCPEQYLISKMSYIADEVNKLLGSASTPAPASSFNPYVVKITYKPYINIRSGAGVNYSVVGTVPYGGAYTIVEEKKNGTQTWGKLKSGAGWICLTGFTKKI